MTHRIIRTSIVPAMDTRDFFWKLLARERYRSVNALARDLKESGKAKSNIQSALSRWLNTPTITPETATMRPIADRFGVSIDAFYVPAVARSEWARLTGGANGQTDGTSGVMNLTPAPCVMSHPFDQGRFESLRPHQQREVAELAAYLVGVFERFNAREDETQPPSKRARPPVEHQEIGGRGARRPARKSAK